MKSKRENKEEKENQRERKYRRSKKRKGEGRRKEAKSHTSSSEGTHNGGCENIKRDNVT